MCSDKLAFCLTDDSRKMHYYEIGETMSQFKKIISAFLSVSLITAIFPISAYGNSKSDIIIMDEEFRLDPFRESAEEFITIENVVYYYRFYIDNTGNRILSIENMDNGETETLKYDIDDLCFYEDNRVVAQIQRSSAGQEQIDDLPLHRGYEVTGTFSYNVSWTMGMSVAAVAAILAVAMFMSIEFIFQSIEMTVLFLIAAKSAGGTIKGTHLQYQPASSPYHFMEVFHIHATNQVVYGKFTGYYSVY